ncbi:MAG: DNA repair protein RadC, partial [Bacteroidota bacterium]
MCTKTQWQESMEGKLAQHGLEALTDQELLTIIISSADAASSLLQEYGSFSLMARASEEELAQLDNVSPYNAHLLVCCFELARRKQLIREERYSIAHSADAYEYIAPRIADKVQEHFYVLYLSRKHEVIAEGNLFIGGVAGIIIDPRIIFKKALHCLASGVIVAHNHPSGNLAPSQADLNITQKLNEAGKWLDIKLLDHLIIT